MKRSLKHELWLLKNKLPKAWEYIHDNYGCCPPILDEMDDDEAEMLCFCGCKLCWGLYFDSFDEEDDA